MNTEILLPEISQDPPIGLWADAARRLFKSKLAILCLVIIIIYVVLALLTWTGLLASQYATTGPDSYAPPSAAHIFGTDIFGRFYTTVDSIPDLLKIIALSFVLGRGLASVYISIGFTTWVNLCRLIRGEFLKHKTRDYVLAASALGAGHTRRMFVHILPNVFHIILINFSSRFILGIKTEVVLSYLGLGVEPGQPSWGVMIDDAKLELARGVWWQLAAATFAMFFLVLAFYILTDALREALDPKLRNKS
jgi:ABC-type dipeptide/oligopeptide/nickel transport system permease subunit